MAIVAPLVFSPELLSKENWILMEVPLWQILAIFSWIAIIFTSVLCYWLLPAATLAVGQGVSGEASLRTVRQIISWAGGTAILLFFAFAVWLIGAI